MFGGVSAVVSVWWCFCSGKCVVVSTHLLTLCVEERICLYDAVSKTELHDAHHPSKTLKADQKCSQQAVPQVKEKLAGMKTS